MKIHSFESLATLDGDGIRYCVYLIGCPLRCIYCHNIDTWTNYKYEIAPVDLAKKIKRYIPYFGKDGGVTFSGGEPLLSAKDINETYKYLQEDNINYVLDTSGAVQLTDDVKLCIDNASLVILDLKFNNDEMYIKYTTRGISATLDMLDYLEKTQKRCWIRTVIVPNINDNTKDIDKYLKIIKNYRCIEKYELLAFHTMGFFKYENLGVENKLIGVDNLCSETLDKLQKYANEEIKKWQ